MLRDSSEEAGSVVDRGHDVRVDFSQQPHQSLPEQHGVIGHHHTHGHQAFTPGARAERVVVMAVVESSR
jgi:hypothetical protein